jgi:hypothetical protein
MLSAAPGNCSRLLHVVMPWSAGSGLDVPKIMNLSAGQKFLLLSPPLHFLSYSPFLHAQHKHWQPHICSPRNTNKSVSLSETSRIKIPFAGYCCLLLGDFLWQLPLSSLGRSISTSSPFHSAVSYITFHQTSIRFISKVDETIISYYSPASFLSPRRSRCHSDSLAYPQDTKFSLPFSKRWSKERKARHSQFQSTHAATPKVEFYTRRIFWPSQNIVEAASTFGEIDWWIFSCLVWRICNLYRSLIARLVAKYSQDLGFSTHVHLWSLANDQSTMSVTFKARQLTS